MLKKIASAVLEIAGIAGVSCGLWMLAPWLGVTVGGIGVLLLGYSIDPPGRGES